MSVPFAAVVALVCTVVPSGATAEPAARSDIARLVAAAGDRPSAYGDRTEIDEALRAGGLPPDAIARLWRRAEVVAPGLGITDMLRVSRDPEWLRARGLFAEFVEVPGGEPLTKKHARRLEAFDGMVSFPEVTVLNVTLARSLRSFGRAGWSAAVEFPAVTELAAEAAAELARCTSLVCLPRLRNLSAATAAALATREGGGLVIGGFPRLTLDAAEALSRLAPDSRLVLPDLESLDSEPLARRLAGNDLVVLPRLATLAPDIAAAFQAGECAAVCLPDLIDLPADVARRLVGAKPCHLVIGGGPGLSPATAAALAGHSGTLVLTGAACPTADACRRLRDTDAALVLQDAAALEPDVAAAFVGRRQLLVLRGITSLDAAQAALLAHLGPLMLADLTSIDATAAEALAPHADQLLLPRLVELPPPVARALARHRGALHVVGLTSLDAQAADALARCPGDLVLDGLASADRATAAALLARDRPLSIAALQDVERLDSVELARLLVARCDDLALYGVTRLVGPDAADIAAALAETRGTLELPSLERITSRALTLLLRKPGVVLPETARLKVVPDPGAADDFVDPR